MGFQRSRGPCRSGVTLTVALLGCLLLASLPSPANSTYDKSHKDNGNNGKGNSKGGSWSNGHANGHDKSKHGGGHSWGNSNGNGNGKDKYKDNGHGSQDSGHDKGSNSNNGGVGGAPVGGFMVVAPAALEAMGAQVRPDGTCWISSVTGQVTEVTAKLRNAHTCSGRLCADLEAYSKAHPEHKAGEAQAKVVLWGPKLQGTKEGNEYDPRTKDWASVVSLLRAVFKHEKRLANFFIRSAFHDSLAVDVSQCPGAGCGGADSSLLLTLEELVRPENAYDLFALRTARVAKKVASFFDVSVADVLAVGGAVAVEVLSAGRVKILDHGLRVGRLDSIAPAPEGQLLPENADLDAWAIFWKARGFNLTEAMALMGSHALIDEQACFRGPTPRDYCQDPFGEGCTDVRMFKWENHYYRDICSGNLTVKPAAPDHPEPLDTPIVGMRQGELDAEVKVESCKFTSSEFRSQEANKIQMIHTGQMRDPELDEAPETHDVFWTNRGCMEGPVPSNCPHPITWFYTINDAFLGSACQAAGHHHDVQHAARKYLDQHMWDKYFKGAYIKLVTASATWSPAAWARPHTIYGRAHECASGTVIDPACAQDGPGPMGHEAATLWKSCKSCTADGCPYNTCCQCFNHPAIRGNPKLTSSACCTCATSFRGLALNETSGSLVAMSAAVRFPDLATWERPLGPLPTAPDAPPVEVDDVDDDDVNALDRIAPDLSASFRTSPPSSPYEDPSDVCPPADGVGVRVDGYPSSPWVWTPFTRPFRRPERAQQSGSVCRPSTATGDTYCVDAYEIFINHTTTDLGCPAGPTRVLTYNGTTPGPTFRQLKGRQSLVRFNNLLTADNLGGFDPYTPCDTSGPSRQGRPTTVHLHGGASLAPYDGWAEDVSCGGESKDYYYANRRPALEWYHDHVLEITTENSYYGLSGMYTVHDNANDGGCGEPWNLDNVPYTEMQLKDAVLDSECQLFYDRFGDHEDNLYGDMNLVNGQPWPVFTVEPRWQRFAWVNSSPARPYKLLIVDEAGTAISGSICRVIAGDGGFRREPAAYPAAGIFIAVAERWEVVCDFTALAGRRLTLWNAKDEDRMDDVPFFCFSHLVMRIEVSLCPGGAPTCAPAGTDFVFDGPYMPALDAVLTPDDIAAAERMVANRECTREFRFGRRRGQWVINGETWKSARVAAGDVGHNNWEVWCLDTGGGWFHPIHIHLVDGYLIARNRELSQVRDYERFTPKDMFQLDEGAELAILVRFGPHRGEYMFHCHNLVHEDFEMMRSFRVVRSPEARMNATVLALNRDATLIENLNVLYDLYADPVRPDFGPRPTAGLPPVTDPAIIAEGLDGGIYRIFYPGGSTFEPPEVTARLTNRALNPWLVDICQPQAP